jgi:hypothetical protein
MADKDITGFSEFFDVWLPTRVKDNVEPIITEAEHTIDQMNRQASGNIRSRLVPLITSNHAMDAKVMSHLDDRISVSEGKNQALDNTVFDRVETKLVPIESNMDLLPLGVCPNVLLIPEPDRENYHYLWMTIDRKSFCVFVFQHPDYPILNPDVNKRWVLLHNFSTWFRAYLAMILLDKQSFRPEQLDNYVQRIEDVQLYNDQANLIPGTIGEFLQ